MLFNINDIHPTQDIKQKIHLTIAVQALHVPINLFNLHRLT